SQVRYFRRISTFLQKKYNCEKRLNMAFLWLFIFCLSTISAASPVMETRINDTKDDYGGYRLPKTQKPLKYEVNLTVNSSVFEGTETAFEGTVKITFQVTEIRQTIEIHGPMDTIDVTILDRTGNKIAVVNNTLNETTEIRTLTLGTNLTKDSDYTLTIKYKGTISTTDMKGFYRSSYNDVSGKAEYLLTTQFQPTHARKAFPCFDEPEFKATFVVSITHPKGLEALSNTPLAGTEVLIDSPYEKTIFKETPKMSTYLIAFIVSKFTCSSGEKIDTDLPYQVCSRNDSAGDRDLAVKYGPLLLEALENITGIKYKEQNIGKMDQAAIPDFSAGAMENWGLVTYRERALLWNSAQSSNSFKGDVLEIIAHEFTHMWFGNWVTCEWWDYTFLNEGFARFFQYFTLAKIPELAHYQIEKQFVIDQQQSVFLSDSSTTSAALTSKAASPSEVWGKFSAISYNKGASILNMLKNFIGEESFSKGIQSYLRAKSFSTAVPTDLWNALQPFSIGLPPGYNLEKVMDNWVNKAGFPLVTVSSQGNNITLSQKRFLYSGTDDTQYFVPISYTLPSDTKPFESVSPKIWLIPGNVNHSITLPANYSWIILNNKGSAYYRVNYDTALWNKIKAALQLNHTLIDVINRAQIVDDSLNLARAGVLKYSDSLEIINFLKYETEYYPWSSAITGLNFLALRLEDASELRKQVDSFMLKLMENVYKSVSFEKLDENDQIYTLKLVLTLSKACALGEKNCVANAKRLFAGMKNGTSVDKNLKSIVYCNGLRYSDSIDSDWQFMWKKMQDSSLSTEQTTVISSLGCTKNKIYLKKYLEQSMNASSGIRTQDLTSVWSSVYASNPEGVDVVSDYIIENHEKLITDFPEVASVVSAIAARFTSEAQVKKLEDWLTTKNLHASLKSAGTAGVTTANDNIKWTNNIKGDLEQYFATSNATTAIPPTTPDGKGGAVERSSSMAVLALEDWLTTKNLHASLKSAGIAAVAAAKENIQWTNNIRNDLEQYFENSANTTAIPLTTTAIPPTTTAIPTTTTTQLFPPPQIFPPPHLTEKEGLLNDHRLWLFWQ
ncbi:hypothetical protein JTB14_010153, partial [Gonioctena quinquepunctata]